MQLKDICAELNDEVYALDIETTGLDRYRDQITCIGVWSPEFQAVYRDLEEFKSQMQPGSRLHGKKFVLHKYDFDYGFLIAKGIFNPNELPQCHDTQLAFHAYHYKVTDSFLKAYEDQRVEENAKLPHGVTHRKARGLSLKVLAPFFLNVKPFWETPDNHDNDEYVLKDCEYTYRLWEKFKELSNDQEQKFYKKLIEWNLMLMQMSLKGIRLDNLELDMMAGGYLDKEKSAEKAVREMWGEHIKAFEKLQQQEIIDRYEEMTAKALEKAKDKGKCIARYNKLKASAISKLEPFNFASSQQMLWLLKDRLKYDVTTLSGEESTRKSVLNRLAEAGHEDVKTYLEWREANKVRTMYLPRYDEMQLGGFIHADFKITGTRTGRLSSAKPNLQQVPSKLYPLFKPRRGYKFIHYDLGGIEAALIALYSEDPKLYEIVSSGGSVHNYNAKAFFNLDCDPSEVAEKYPAERRAAKTVGFALIYGAGWKRIKEAFATANFHISDSEAKEKYKNYQSYYSAAFEFQRGITEVFEEGEIVYNLFGRPLHKSSMTNCYMQGFNTLIQSSASDLNVAACYKAALECQQRHLDAYPLLLVHDMILFEAKEEMAEKCNEVLTRNMLGFNLKNDLGKLPLTVDGGIFNEWTKT